LMRANGGQVIPALGWRALAQLVFPLAFGAEIRAGGYMGPGNLLESAAGAYIGLIPLCVFVPPAFVRRKREALLWLGVALFGLGYTLALPGFELLFTTPPFSLLRGNRLTFLTAWALCVLVALGADVLADHRRSRGVGAALGVGVAGALALAWWCRAGTVGLLPFSGTEFPLPFAVWHTWISAAQGALACIAAGCGIWLLVGLGRSRDGRRGRLRGPVVGVTLACVGELLFTYWGLHAQDAPERYYPPLPELQELVREAPGRVCGMGVLLPDLAMMQGLPDIRGYDAIDPLRLVQVLERVNPAWTKRPEYAVTQSFVARSAPMMHAMNLRYLIFRGARPPGFVAEGTRVVLETDAYWVAENLKACGRAFVPRHVQGLPDAQARLTAVTDLTFDPHARAIVPPVLSELEGLEIRGEVTVVCEQPGLIEFRVKMETPGIVVVSESWHPGWSARLVASAADLPVYETDYLLIGVGVPAGEHRVRLRYCPPGFRWLSVLAALAGILVVWLGVSRRAARRQDA
jgi:hypothetical protein